VSPPNRKSANSDQTERSPAPRELSWVTFRLAANFWPILQVLEDLTFGDVARYRKDASGAREAFLEHLGTIQAKQGSLKPDEDYQATISKIIQTENVPAARTFKNKMDGIRDDLFGNLAKGVVGALGTTSMESVGLSLFGALSWPHLLALAGPAAAYATKAAIDAVVAKRATARECAISYVLNLD
jgi:hypothetical protein